MEATVYILDDDEAVRRSLEWLISSVKLPVQSFAHPEELLSAADPNWCGCLLLDVRLPGTGGLEVLTQFIQQGMHLPIIVLTGHADVPMAVRALKSGAFDFFEKPYNDQLLLDSIHQAIEQCRQTQAKIQALADIRKNLHQLTNREREVLDALLDGQVNKQIAARLNISIKTVEVHRANVMRKMEAKSLPELVKMVVLAEMG